MSTVIATAGIRPSSPPSAGVILARLTEGLPDLAIFILVLIPVLVVIFIMNLVAVTFSPWLALVIGAFAAFTVLATSFKSIWETRHQQLSQS